MSRIHKSGRKIRYTVVGLGHLAQVAVLPFKGAQNSELVAIVSCDAEKRDRVGRKYESARTGRVVELPELPPKKRPTSQQEIHRAPHGKPKTVNVQSASGD